MDKKDLAKLRQELKTKSGKVTFYNINELKKMGYESIAHMPTTLKILLEGLIRQLDDERIAARTGVSIEHIHHLLNWQKGEGEIPFIPARVLMQDFTGVPCIVDLAAMRDALEAMGGDPQKINPLIPVDLVIDHSIQIDKYGSARAADYNTQKEFERNRERYEFLRWAALSFDNFSVVPPATGIVHQINLEYLAKVVQVRKVGNRLVAFPDTVVGTDSHTTMINGLGVLGWGVGGIEAEAASLGEPITFTIPEVIGFKLTGELNKETTATDLVLTVTRMLRDKGVVEKFVEFYGPGLKALSLPDRAVIANMSPEYGATVGFSPVDGETLRYLRQTKRPDELIALIEQYTKATGLYNEDNAPEPEFSSVLELDLSQVRPSIAGPKKPHQHVPINAAKQSFVELVKDRNSATTPVATLKLDKAQVELRDGSVVIAAITSCTNTSSPPVMIAAGLLAQKAVAFGLHIAPYVKTSLAPGSRVVTRYLQAAGLLPYLEALGFHLAGYGCTTCIGNSGPLQPQISKAIKEQNLIVASVLSGNRNFEGRVHSDVKANYLASPPLVVAYALAGRVDIDLTSEPLGYTPNEEPVYLKDIWPSRDEITAAINNYVKAEFFQEEYQKVDSKNPDWNNIQVKGGKKYNWSTTSTYIRKPIFFDGLTLTPKTVEAVKNARVLAYLGDSITTDHISPAGSIAANSQAALWLTERGVKPEDFNSYGSRRGNHEVMMRGTFGNTRIRNKLVPAREGSFSVHLPTSQEMSIFEAAAKYQAEGTALIVIGGKDYGMGSSRDWAAKGTYLLGIKAVLAESFERIHRNNLVGMGVLPLQFLPNENAASLGLTGQETYNIELVTTVGQTVTVDVKDSTRSFAFKALVRIDTPQELNYYQHQGILQALLRRMAG
jgi:aconitate hydratase